MWRFLFLSIFTASLAAAQIAPSAALNAIGFSTVVTQETLPGLIVQDASQQRADPQLQPGDVILAADRHLVASANDLQKPEFCRGRGTLMRLDVYRPSQNSFFEDTLASDGRCPDIQAYMWLVPRLALQVSEVASQSLASQYGLQPGDVLLAAGKALLVGSAQELSAKADQLATQIATTPDFGLLFRRGGRVYTQKFHVASSTVSGNAVTGTQEAAASASPSPSSVIQETTPTPTAAQSPPPDNPVATVQQFLRSQQRSHRFPITGTWNAQTLEYVSGFVQALERKPLSAYPWTGPTDGVYSDAFSAYIKHAATVMKSNGGDDQAWAAQLESFALAMDQIKRSGIYQESQGPAEDNAHVASSSAKQDDGDFVFPAMLWLANGALSEFGDEMWCAFTHGTQTFSACHADAAKALARFDAENHIVAQVCYFIGTFMNPITLILIALGKQGEMSPPAAIFLGLSLGTVDFFLYVIGDWWTKGSLSGVDYPQMFASAAIAALLTAFAIATHDPDKDRDVTIHRWRR